MESIPSTNWYLKELLKQRHLPECSVVITQNQTRGRGQQDNGWESEPFKNLTFSIVFYPHYLKAAQQFIISKCVSVAIAEVLAGILPQFAIKWPNDLYCGAGKVGGILIENSLKGMIIEQCVAGIGINVNQEIFHSSAPNPLSIKGITGRETDLTELFQQIYESLLTQYAQLSSLRTETINERYLHFLFRKEGWHRYRDAGGNFEAQFAEIESSGHLVLQRKDGSFSRYAFKEVSFEQMGAEG